MLTYVLLLMMHLAPNQTRDQLMPQADAIAQVAQTEEEATILTVISFYETTFHPERRAWIAPFGLTCCYRYSAPMAFWAWKALMIMDEAGRQCGRSYDLRFGFFHSGACTRDSYASQEARTTRRLLQRYATNFHGTFMIQPIATR